MMDPHELVTKELLLTTHVFNENKVIHPMFVFIKDDHRTMMAAEFRNDMHKEMLAQGVKDLVKQSEPDAVVYMAEAWAAYVKIEDYKETTRAYDHPDKVEVVVVRIEFKTGEKYDCEAKIIRKKGDARLDKWSVMPGGYSMGRFVDFFPVKNTDVN